MYRSRFHVLSIPLSEAPLEQAESSNCGFGGRLERSTTTPPQVIPDMHLDQTHGRPAVYSTSSPLPAMAGGAGVRDGG